ncbi:MAG: DMT family transporter [Gammaproteobacteria bacterium]|nr:DMT family transporter [Gammaproteobacteria bacterium]
MSADSLHRSAWCVLVSSLAFASMAAMIKHLAVAMPTEMMVFFRNGFGLLALAPLLLRSGVSLKTEHLRWHIGRALYGVTAMYCFFYALGKLPLADAVLLNYTAPIFTPLIALLWLHERVPSNVRWAIAVGFIGVSLILKPGHDLFSPATLVGLASGVFAALAMTSIRRMAQTEPALRIVFYFAVVATAVSAVPLLWAWQSAAWDDLLPLAGVGILASVGQLFLTKAYTLAPAARVGALTYATVVFAAALGWFVWGEMLDIFSLGGAALVGIGGAMAMRRFF